MLRDVKFNGDNGQLGLILAIVTGSARPTRIREGVYTDCGFNFSNFVSSAAWEAHWYDEAEPFPSYGVADSVDQFFDRFGDLIVTSPATYAIGFTEVRRADQPSEDGWRWHKWGEYVGTREPQYEYLHDEPEIDSVVTFAILRRVEQ